MGTQARGFKITVFAPDGTPDGMKIVEKSNWTGRAIICPRSKFADLRERQEFRKTGVYLLIGSEPDEDFPAAYIGEGDPAGDRLLQLCSERRCSEHGIVSGQTRKFRIATYDRVNSRG